MFRYPVVIDNRRWTIENASSPMLRALEAFAVTAAFALLGWAVEGVTAGGAMAGFAVAFLLFYGIGPGAFAVLFAVFAITWITTRLGQVRKQRLGIAERRRGRRTAGQVLANIGVSGAFAAAAIAGHKGWAVHAALAALAEAAADTSSSECGEASSDVAFLIPRFRRVAAGVDGAITVVGTAAGIAASAAIAALALALQVVPTCAAVSVGIAGIAGMLFDTMLGATLERRGLLNNNGVNLASTVAAALMGLALHRAICL